MIITDSPRQFQGRHKLTTDGGKLKTDRQFRRVGLAHHPAIELLGTAHHPAIEMVGTAHPTASGYFA